MMLNKFSVNDDVLYAAVQNGVILDVFKSYDEAAARIQKEEQNDLLQIVLQRKLRKLFKKTGDVALHHYCVLMFQEVANNK